MAVAADGRIYHASATIPGGADTAPDGRQFTRPAAAGRTAANDATWDGDGIRHVKFFPGDESPAGHRPTGRRQGRRRRHVERVTAAR